MLLCYKIEVHPVSASVTGEGRLEWKLTYAGVGETCLSRVTFELLSTISSCWILCQVLAARKTDWTMLSSAWALGVAIFITQTSSSLSRPSRPCARATISCTISRFTLDTEPPHAVHATPQEIRQLLNQLCRFKATMQVGNIGNLRLKLSRGILSTRWPCRF